MARNPREDVVESLMVALGQLRGAYSLLLQAEGCLIAARDPFGFRPLMLGDAQGSPCFASEVGAFDLIGATPVRELKEGEVVVSRDGQLEFYRLPEVPQPTRCIFEHVYFARPDSVAFGDAVSEVRLRLGQQLARESAVEADLVSPVPDSGVFAALGYSRASGIPFEFGLIRNHYVGRTFIEPQNSIRHFGVKVKLNPVRPLIEGRRVVLVDDSIVRGTTSRKIVKMVRDAGAREVHLRISSPPTAWPCRYGIDTPSREELIAANQTVEQIRDFVGADSLSYLTLEGMLGAVSGPNDSYCTACFTGDYRVAMSGEDERQHALFSHPGRGRSMSSGAYRAAGVDIDAQDEALDEVKGLVRSTLTEGVLSELGAFGGLFRLPDGLEQPILVASADGVGTKLRVAQMADDYTTVGQCLVNHCVNDILVQGAEPLFFLDYVGAGVLAPEKVVELVKGVANGCRQNGCALLGGETAEMPGFYQPGDYELAGFIVGVVEQARLLGPDRVAVGDVLIGLDSSGLHTNGYSLARHLLFERLGLAVDDELPVDGDDRTVGQALLEVHRTYLPALRPLLSSPDLHALAHITGGGLTDNLPRVLPDHCAAVVDRGSWQPEGLFALLQEAGAVDLEEMFRVFNMGVGMVAVVEAAAAEAIVESLSEFGETPWVLGQVEAGSAGVRYHA